jgi:hypothetical protein
MATASRDGPQGWKIGLAAASVILAANAFAYPIVKGSLMESMRVILDERALRIEAYAETSIQKHAAIPRHDGGVGREEFELSKEAYRRIEAKLDLALERLHAVTRSREGDD